MQKLTASALILGALLIAAALVYHGRQLALVAGQLATLEQRTGALDQRLNTFSEELPTLVGEAGKEAGRQAVHGVIEEAVQKPMNRVRTQLGFGTATASTNATGTPPGETGLLPGGSLPWIRFDIPDPVINIDIQTNLKEWPELPWSGAAETNLPSADAPPLPLERTGS